jgi:integrase/recombinase XerD
MPLNVYFDDEASVSLSLYLQSRKDDNKALFVTKAKPYNRMGKSGIEQLIRNIGRRSKLSSNLFPHRLRHTFATRFLNRSNGQNVTSLMKLMGHEKFDTTMIYAKLSKDQIEHDYRTFLS